MFGKGTCKQKEIDNECVVACLGQCVKRESCASVENLVGGLDVVHISVLPCGVSLVC